MSYKIVKIVDEYLVVVDYGEYSDAQIGDVLEIYQIGEEVFQPDEPGDLLGTLDIVKGRIKVINVYEKMSLCRSAETTANPSNFLTISSAMAKAFSNYEIKALNVNTKQVSGGYNENENLVINIGDPVRVVKSKHKNLLKEE